MLDRASQLVSGLIGEKERWENTVAVLDIYDMMKIVLNVCSINPAAAVSKYLAVAAVSMVSLSRSDIWQIMLKHLN